MKDFKNNATWIVEEFEKWLRESIKTIKDTEYVSCGVDKAILKDRAYTMNMILKKFEELKG